MAGWIGGSDYQRFFQYTLPAHQRELKSRWWVPRLAEIERRVEALKAAHAAGQESPLDARQYERRLQDFRREYKGILIAKAHSERMVEAGRRIRAGEVSFSKAFTPVEARKCRNKSNTLNTKS